MNRKKQPATHLIENLNFHEPLINILPNGLPVYVINAGSQDVVKIDFVFRAGSWFEEKPLAARYSHKMLREGAGSRTSAEIAETIDYFGAYLDTSNDQDFSTVSLFSLTKYFHELLPLTEEIIKNPHFPPKEFEVLNMKQRQKFLIKNQKVKFIARRKFYDLLYSDYHPYGKSPQLSDYDNININDLESFHNEYYGAGNCFIIISGKVTDKMIGMLEKHFGQTDWLRAGRPEEKLIFPIKSREKSCFLEKESAVQSAIRLGKVLFNKTHADFLKLKILSTILGGYFGSRLMSSIREEKGFTYGIGSGMASMQHSGYFFIASEVGSDVVKEAIQEILREIEIIISQPVPEEELNLVKNYILGSFQRSLDGPFALSDSVRSLAEYGLNIDYYKNYIALIKSVTAEELLETAQKHLDPGSFTVLSVGSKNHI
ncbi:MAG: insulinase family protein [Bacteroidales bacterium]|nr:insulinase family protein [Bacteroidales bacterium]